MEHVPRSRLLARLQKGLAHKLILISAPAGYGKTTLACEWLASCGQLSAWVSLDNGDNDPARFWVYVLAGLQNTLSSIGKNLPDSLRHHNPQVNEALITELINEIDKLEQSLILVLDDYHNIENQVIHEELTFLLENSPENFHLVIATRADPPLPLARLRAHTQITELRLADLRFTTSEIIEFLRTAMSIDLSEVNLSLLEASTEGWIAGLQMAGLSLQGREDISTFIRSFSGNNRYILDYLFEEVFLRQSDGIRDFLLKTSILEQFCDPLCNAITRREDSQSFLNTLERSNLFLISLDEERKWYRYHHLFADLLRSRLKQTFPTERALLHQRASAWYESEHDLENAIPHTLATGDFEHAADLIEEITHNLDMQNKQPVLARWVKNLPPEILKAHPWLCVYRAWGDYWTGSRGLEEEWLQAAEQFIEQTIAESHPEKMHIQGHIAAVRAHTALVARDIPRALEMGKKALELLPNDDEMRFEAAIALGAAYWAIGDVVRSEQAFGLDQASTIKISHTSRAAGSNGYVGIQQIKQGRLQDALTTFRAGLQKATLPNGNETPLSGFLNMRLGDVLRERNELALASQYLLRGMEQCILFNQPDILTDAYICSGRYQLAIGDLAQTQKSLQNADRVARETKIDAWVWCWLDDLRLKVWLTEGNLEAASLWAKNSGLAPEGPFSYQHDLHHQNLARVLVAQACRSGSKPAYETAASLLARLLIAAEQAGWTHEEIRILVMQAVNYQAQNMEDAAIKSLASAVSLAEPGGFVRVFLDEGDIIRDLLITFAGKLQNDGRITRQRSGGSSQDEHRRSMQVYIARLISAFDHASASTEMHPFTNLKKNRNAPKMVEPLSAREMEVLQHLAQGSSDKKIAETLVIARETVHKHLKNIYGKLGVHSRTEAIVRARESGLL